jgi:hypothetical protein
MDYIREDVLKSDALIFGTPVHMGYATAIMMTFLERICWIFAKPEGKSLSIYGCPIPRSNKTRKSIIIVTSGIIPPLLRKLSHPGLSRHYSESFVMKRLHLSSRLPMVR